MAKIIFIEANIRITYSLFRTAVLPSLLREGVWGMS